MSTFQFNTSVCCFDGGDCYLAYSHQLDDCIQRCDLFVEQNNNHRYGFIGDPRQFLHNFICDFNLNVKQCCYDFGDCNTVQQSVCPSCLENTLHLRNYYCNRELNNVQCCFDSGDCFHDRFQCATCNEDMSWHRDLICDQSLYHFNCCYDGGDCSCPSCPFIDHIESFPNKTYPAMIGWYSMGIGNMQCDRLLDAPECCYDAFDCQVSRR